MCSCRPTIRDQVLSCGFRQLSVIFYPPPQYPIFVIFITKKWRDVNQPFTNKRICVEADKKEKYTGTCVSHHYLHHFPPCPHQCALYPPWYRLISIAPFANALCRLKVVPLLDCAECQPAQRFHFFLFLHLTMHLKVHPVFLHRCRLGSSYLLQTVGPLQFSI